MPAAHPRSPRRLLTGPEHLQDAAAHRQPLLTDPAPLQDATEYLQHLLEVMTRAERAAGDRLPHSGPPAGPTARAFDVGVESRVQCGTSGAVSYTREATNVWSLSIPLDAMTNRAELEASQVGAKASWHLSAADLQVCFGALVRQACAATRLHCCAAHGA